MYSLSALEEVPLPELHVRVYPKLQSLLVHSFGIGSLGSIVVAVLLEKGDTYTLILPIS